MWFFHFRLLFISTFECEGGCRNAHNLTPSLDLNLVLTFLPFFSLLVISGGNRNGKAGLPYLILQCRIHVLGKITVVLVFLVRSIQLGNLHPSGMERLLGLMLVFFCTYIRDPRMEVILRRSHSETA